MNTPNWFFVKVEQRSWNAEDSIQEGKKWNGGLLKGLCNHYRVTHVEGRKAAVVLHGPNFLFTADIQHKI